MSDIWITADLHLGHKHLVTGWDDADRGPMSGPRGHFGTVEQHDEQVIANFNSLVKPQDKVYILGDLALSKIGLESSRHLQGHKRLVLGNHDQADAKVYISIFEKVCGAKTLDGMVLTHVPVHPSQLGIRRSMQVNVHGHLHEERVKKIATGRPYYPDDPNYIMRVDDPLYLCVSLEQNDYRPFHIDEVKAKFGGLLKC